jgi:hypothetical protein
LRLEVKVLARILNESMAAFKEAAAPGFLELTARVGSFE